MTTAMILFLIAAWVAVGAVTAIVMGRRGHDLALWAILGSFFGPLVIPFAIVNLDREREATVRRVGEPASSGAGGGPVDVLVGIDGSPESRAALAATLGLLRDRAGRVTLATVLPYEVAMYEDLGPPPYPRDAEAARGAAETALRQLAVEVAPGADTVLLPGAPGEALARHAAEGGYDLIAVGPRGRGLARAVLGSVATQLARSGKTAVLIAGR